MQGQTSVPTRRPVRQVTLLKASWCEGGRSVRGAFELTLRDEGGEYVLQAAPEDADTLLTFLVSSRGAWAEASLMQT